MSSRNYVAANITTSGLERKMMKFAGNNVGNTHLRLLYQNINLANESMKNTWIISLSKQSHNPMYRVFLFEVF